MKNTNLVTLTEKQKYSGYPSFSFAQSSAAFRNNIYYTLYGGRMKRKGHNPLTHGQNCENVL